MDILVVGAGAVGLSTALHAAQAGHAVTVLEKESGPGRHQSGRNSGVIHAGYNLKPGSAKARYCVAGNRELRAYCRRRGVPLAENGILVVARSAAEEPALDALRQRARANGVQARWVAADGIADIEPHATGTAALHAPDGASLDPGAYVQALAADAAEAGAVLRYGVRVHRLDETTSGVVARTDAGPVGARVAVNAAGLHADALARATDVRVVPFRGTYAELVPERRHLVRAHVYGVPDLHMPFLGVHLSRQTDGRVLVGPGALLAGGREAYSGLRVDALRPLAWRGFWRLMARRPMRRLAWREAAKALRLEAVRREAGRLVPALRRGDLRRSAAGIRAQLVDRQGALVDDIVVRTTPRAVHVLNAVSPGLTCSLPFGRHLATEAAKQI